MKNLKSHPTSIRHTVKVYVGYAWDNDTHCKNHSSWVTISKYFKKTRESLAKKYNVNIDFRRLRASHGCFIWNSILSKIKAADILIFDVADKKYKGRFNQNVLLELGAAMALEDKKVIILCPKGSKFPSDLSGLCLSLYEGKDKKMDDRWGLLPQFSGMVREIVTSRGWWQSSKIDDYEEEEERLYVAQSK